MTFMETKHLREENFFQGAVCGVHPVASGDLHHLKPTFRALSESSQGREFEA